MNYHSMMKEYKSVDSQSKLETANDHEYIKLILNDLLKNLQSLSYSIQNEPIRSTVKSKSFSQILIALMILQSSLDFDRGEPVASNLYNLYEFCRKSVLSNYRTREFEKIDASASIISDILSAWEVIN